VLVTSVTAPMPWPQPQMSFQALAATSPPKLILLGSLSGRSSGSGFGVAPWLRTVPAGDLRGVERAIQQGETRFGLPATAAVSRLPTELDRLTTISEQPGTALVLS